jgi:peroxiredoxin Q/BCP
VADPSFSISTRGTTRPDARRRPVGSATATTTSSSGGAVVLGVSPDEETSHVKFKQKYGLPFTLLADPEHEVSELYEVWGEKKYMGRTYMGVERSTFLIDSDGRIAKVMRKVKPDTHVERVLEALPG